MTAKQNVATRKRGRETRESLMNAGLNLMANQGYHRMKVSDVVEKTGVTQASFYWYFKSKLQMALEVIDAGRIKLVEVVQRGYREEHGTLDDMLKNSEKLLIDLIEFSEANRDFMIVLLSRGHGADPKVDDAISETRKEFFDALYRNIARAQELQMLPDKGDAQLKAVFLHRLIEGAIEWRLFGNGYDINHCDKSDVNEFAQQLVKFEFFGLTGK